MALVLIRITTFCLLCAISSCNSNGMLKELGKISGDNVAKWTEHSEVNPEELGEYAEGDIVFPVGPEKNGLIRESTRWPQAIVPLDVNAYFSEKEKQLIASAIRQYHKNTCIRFRSRRPEDEDWVSIVSGYSGCWSSVGRVGGKQEVNLQRPGCVTKIGTVIHELLHALGFHHEQNRWERDSYVKIMWENIRPGKESNFEKSDNETVTGFGVAYDYGSVMHYSEKAFSLNRQPTIITKKEGAVIGQREGFSQMDIDKLRKMYNCPPSNENPNYTEQNGVNLTNHGGGGGGGLGGLISLLLP